MKTRIALGAGLLLTLGSAVAGTYIYGQTTTQPGLDIPHAPATMAVAVAEPTLWDATAVADYVELKLPI